MASAFTFLVSAQSKFEVTSIGKSYSKEAVLQAFEHANFCGSFYQNKRNVLTMDDGTIVELKSADELKLTGIQLTEDCILPSGSTYYECVWSIADNGLLLKGFQSDKYKSEKEYKHVQHEN